MKRILSILIFGLLSCDSKNGVEFVIHNESTKTIDSVTFSTSDKKATIKLMEIQKAQTKGKFLDMREIVKADGNYFVEIHTPGLTNVNSIGYYTNGFSLDEKINIYFRDDTIKYKFD